MLGMNRFWGFPWMVYWGSLPHPNFAENPGPYQSEESHPLKRSTPPAKGGAFPDFYSGLIQKSKRGFWLSLPKCLCHLPMFPPLFTPEFTQASQALDLDPRNNSSVSGVDVQRVQPVQIHAYEPCSKCQDHQLPRHRRMMLVAI